MAPAPPVFTLMLWLLILYTLPITMADMKKQLALPRAKHIDWCPPLCSCDRSARSASCSALSIEDVASLNIPSDVKCLNLQGNQIGSIAKDTFLLMKYLVELDLSSNALTVESISPNAFEGNSDLRVLRLKGNQLCRGDNGTLALLAFLVCLDTPIVELELASNGLRHLDMEQPKAQPNNTILVEVLDLSYNLLEKLPPNVGFHLPHLRVFNLCSNQFTSLSLTDETNNSSTAINNHAYFNTIYHTWENLEQLLLSQNKIQRLECNEFLRYPNLKELDISYNILNSIPSDCFTATNGDKMLRNLTRLSLSGNPINYLHSQTFSGLAVLEILQLSSLRDLSFLEKDTFSGLAYLKELDLSGNKHLEYLHAATFSYLSQLKILDISNSALKKFYPPGFQNLDSITEIRLVGNPLACDCDIEWLYSFMKSPQHDSAKPQPYITCASPSHVHGQSLVDLSPLDLICDGAVIINQTEQLVVPIGSQAVLDCAVWGTLTPNVTWITPHGQVLRFNPALMDRSKNPSFSYYHRDHSWHEGQHYANLASLPDRILVLQNGSLYIDYISRQDAGNYSCFLENHLGNDSIVVELLLDYHIIKQIMIFSCAVGFIAALGFLFIAIIVSVIRYVAFRCSRKERTKRKSIREVLEAIHDYKTTQIDKFKDYKMAKIDQLTAFKSAKKEQFVAKKEQLIAFKAAKIDKLRTYKQVTVASIFHQLERMRIHYHLQMTRIKDSCSQQADRLRDNYSNQVTKLKGYRTGKLEKLRDNYTSQSAKICDYGSQQLEKLREQYKLQQQYLLKLMELLDIGNCMTAIEAECMRTESTIFDPHITFDIEAQPVHVPREPDLDADSEEYVSAASQSNMSSFSEPTILFDHRCNKPEKTHTCRTQQKHNGSGGHCISAIMVNKVSLSRKQINISGSKERTRKRHRRKRKHIVSRGFTFPEGMPSAELPPLDTDSDSQDNTCTSASRQTEHHKSKHFACKYDSSRTSVTCSHACNMVPDCLPENRPSSLSVDNLTLSPCSQFPLKESRKRSVSESVSTDYESAIAYSPSREYTPWRESMSEYESAHQSSREPTPDIITDTTLTPPVSPNHMTRGTPIVIPIDPDNHTQLYD